MGMTARLAFALTVVAVSCAMLGWWLLIGQIPSWLAMAYFAFNAIYVAWILLRPSGPQTTHR